MLPHAEAYKKEIKRGQKGIVKMMERQQVPGLAMAVSIKNKIIWKEGFGKANIEHNIAVNPDSSQFRVGSISKPFTATAVALLYEQEKLDLDAEIQEYVVGFPNKKYPITVRQIGGHLAGIRHYKGREFTSNKHYDNVLEGLSVFKDDPLVARPLAKFNYSSYGWNLLSAAVEDAANQPFLDYMQQAVFVPLGMQMTCADKKDSLLVHRTGFYSRKGNQVKVSPEVDNSVKWAGGGFLSSVTDVLRFGNAYLKPDLLSQVTINEFWENQQTASGKMTYYGIGWQIWEDGNGYLWYGHSGGAVGGTSQLLIQPDKEIVLVMLTNLTDVNLKYTLKRIAESFTAPKK